MLGTLDRHDGTVSSLFHFDSLFLLRLRLGFQPGGRLAGFIRGIQRLGLVCHKCGCKMWVVDTDPVVNGVRRYRECRNCGYRKATFER